MIQSSVLHIASYLLLARHIGLHRAERVFQHGTARAARGAMRRAPAPAPIPPWAPASGCLPRQGLEARAKHLTSRRPTFRASA